jgi:hypothetical protein
MPLTDIHFEPAYPACDQIVDSGADGGGNSADDAVTYGKENDRSESHAKAKKLRTRCS